MEPTENTQTEDTQTKIVYCSSSADGQERNASGRCWTGYAAAAANRKRIESQRWQFGVESYPHEVQLEFISRLFGSAMEAGVGSVAEVTYIDAIVLKTIRQQILRKLQGYKYQDTVKHRLVSCDDDEDISLQGVLKEMLDSRLICRYCSKQMFVLYDIAREMSQWTIDRVDNSVGHVEGNYHLACLGCNLKRRRRSDRDFYVTKRAVIIRQGYVAATGDAEDNVSEETEEKTLAI